MSSVLSVVKIINFWNVFCLQIVAIYTIIRIQSIQTFKQIESMYSVEKILAKRTSAQKKGKFEYLIKWDGWDISQSTWEPEKHLQYIRDMINEFQRNQGANRESSSDQSSFFNEKKSKPSKRKPKMSSKQQSSESYECFQNLPEERKSAKQPPKLKENSQGESEKISVNESTNPSLACANQNKGVPKPKTKVLGMRKQGTKEFWYYVSHCDGSQSWVARDYLVQHHPISLIEFYEEKIVFSN